MTEQSKITKFRACPPTRFVICPLGRWSPRKIVVPVCIGLLVLLLEGCSEASVHQPITLTLLDWQYTGEAFAKEYEQEFRQFTKETGNRVRFLPSAETPQQRLAVFRKFLGTGSSNVDVYSIDVIWPEIV